MQTDSVSRCGRHRLGCARSGHRVLARQARARRGARRQVRPRVADVAARRRARAEGAGRRRARRAGDPRRRRAARLRRAHRQAARRRRQRQRQDRAHRGRRRAAAGGDPPRRRARGARSSRSRRDEATARTRRGCNAGDALAISYAADRRLHGGARRPCRAAFVRGAAATSAATALGQHRGHRLRARRRSASTGVETSGGADRGARSSSTPPARGRALIGRLAGQKIPLFPARHQLCITEPLSEVVATHPTVRVMDARFYVRPCRGGLMFGAYEPDPLMVDPAQAAARLPGRRPRVGHGAARGA